MRRNVAQKWGLKTLLAAPDGGPDPWQVLFDAAASDRPAGANELMPYWIYEVPGGARVERRVSVFPFSREVGKLDRLQRGLAVYRLAFGQPRQEDLLAYLAGREGVAVGERISLEPGGGGVEEIGDAANSWQNSTSATGPSIGTPE